MREKFIIPEKRERIVKGIYGDKAMEYEDFLKKVKELAYVQMGHGEEYTYSYRRDKNKGEEQICISWTTGGMTGGSCWDTGDDPARYYAVSGEPEPEFEDLDKILEEICPSISFLQYKGICREVVKTDNYSQNDYYGNYTTKGVKYCLIKDLYDVLCAKELL